jgi:hypothetical protein
MAIKKKVDDSWMWIRDFEMPEELPDARCRTADPDAWFQEDGGAYHQQRQICLMCVERLKCLQGAVRRRESYGMWGGYTARRIRDLYLAPLQGCEPPPVQPVEIVTEERVPGRARRHLGSREFGLTRAG